MILTYDESGEYVTYEIELKLIKIYIFKAVCNVTRDNIRFKVTKAYIVISVCDAT